MKAKCFRALIMWLFFFGASLVWNVWPTLRRLQAWCLGQVRF